MCAAIGLENTQFRLNSEPQNYFKKIQSLDRKLGGHLVNSKIKKIKIRQLLEKESRKGIKISQGMVHKYIVKNTLS